MSVDVCGYGQGRNPNHELTSDPQLFSLDLVCGSTPKSIQNGREPGHEADAKAARTWLHDLRTKPS